MYKRQPQRGVSRDGFEMQLATNFLGHFALTGLLLSSLRKSSDPRVVTLASIAVNRGRIDFDDLQSERSYDPYAAYAQSKLACLMMAFELQRRSLANNWGVRSVAAHPGVAVTELVERGPGPVSYTHLDVYKRQAQAGQRHQQQGAAGDGHRDDQAGFQGEGVETHGVTPFRDGAQGMGQPIGPMLPLMYLSLIHI